MLYKIKGHTYAAKWLWNRLIVGPSFNFSSMRFSQGSYYCPSVACPYFRTVQNLEHCTVLSEVEYRLLHFTTNRPKNGSSKVSNLNVSGTILYFRSKRATMGRFETVAEA
ncbi:hypothetical protein DICVIV_04538 [Dictyocaulus viviparus]|uniref:Uncharacterized protein n=1 Tax=Dictyocaulus viviparus TaxID=29172 RepID=A0A0D8XXW9_DICVI|nr:hypothetical protein DICVIV_04538 [Dictyocaulus viviparus]